MDSVFWKFVEDNINVNPSQLRLKYHGKNTGFDVDLAITQIECRKKFGKKLAATLSQHPHFIFPSVLSGEQSTSDLLAQFHASLIPEAASVIDLTAGLGIDALHFSECGHKVTVVEIDEQKIDSLRHNCGDDIEIIHGDCQEIIETLIAEGQHFSVAFIDPARRGAVGQRVFALFDCQPDVTAFMPSLRKLSDKLIVKLSPMLDISSVASSLSGIDKIIALGSSTECKEIVAICDFDSSKHEANYEIEATTLCPAPISMIFTPAEEREAKATYSIPQNGGYIYEPYPSVMKAAPFDLISTRYKIDKLSPNTQLYWSPEPNEDFPGKGYKILSVMSYASKHIKRLHREYPAAQVATRNFDISADALRKKLAVREGDQVRIYGTTLADSSPYLIVCAPNT